MNDKILRLLREYGPLNEDMLALLAEEDGVREAAEAMASGNAINVIHYTRPDGKTVASLYFHPGCKFRVANFR